MLRNDIVVISPTANANFEVGKPLSICWAYNSAEARLSIQLQLASGEPRGEVCRDIPNYGVYCWTPLGVPSGSYRLAIRSDSAEGASAAFALKEGRPCGNPMALVERILDASPQELSLSALASYSAYAVPTLPFSTGKATRHFTYGALVEQKKTSRPKPAKQAKVTARTSGPTVTLTASEVRRCLHQMLNDPLIAVDQALPNGDTVGQFAIKYILMHAQRRENKREKADDD
jgi:hypothetical protein